MLLGARQFFERRGAPTPPLPYDAEVEYLGSSGVEYINTGVVPTIDTIVSLDCMAVTFVGWGGVIGSCTSDNSADSYLVRENGAATVKGYSATVDSKSNVNQILVDDGVLASCYLSKATFEVNGTVKTLNATAFTVDPTLPMYMFTVNLGGAPWQFRSFKGRIFSCKIYNGTTLVRDFIPVRFTNELGQSEGAMYDRVSGQLFRNQGTGNFIVGRDTNPISARSYVNDGLIAMWDGIENAGWGTHDANATMWVDLSNNGHNLTIPSTIAFGDDYGMASDKGGAVIRRPSSVYDAIVSAGGYTIEAVFESSGVNGAIATVGNENTIYSFSTSRASFRASDKYNGSGSNLTLQYSTATTSVAKKSWAMTVELGEETLLYENATINRIVSYGGIAGMQYPQFVGIGLNSSYPGSNDGAGGKYYSVRLYSRAITAAEIAANYAIDKARFNLP